MSEPRVDTDGREYPHPDHAQIIQFEGCDCVVMSPEDYQSLWDVACQLERELNEANSGKKKYHDTLVNITPTLLNGRGSFTCGEIESAVFALFAERDQLRKERDEVVSAIGPFAKFGTSLIGRRQVPESGDWYSIDTGEPKEASIKIEDFQQAISKFNQLK